MNYYRKPINKAVNDVKLKMQIAALTLKLSENNDKIDDLFNVDKNIKKDVSDNLNLINSNKENIFKKNNEIYKKGLLITSNNTSIYDHKQRLDVIEKNIKNIPLNSTEIINIKTNFENIENTIKNYNTDIIKIPDIENDITDINSNIKDLANIETTLDNVKYRQGVINIILDRLTPLNDITKNNTINITNNYNISQINKKRSEFNTTLIDNDINNIKSIKNDIDNYYKLKDIIISDIQNTNISEDIHINSPIFTFIQSSLNNNFKKDSYLEFDSSILLFFNKHYINIGFFHILLEYFNDENTLIKAIKLPLASGSIPKFCSITNSCIVKIPDNYDKIYFKLSIKVNDRQNRTDFISILDFDNKIYFKYYEK